MKISDVMTREVETIGPDQTAREAAAFMLSADTGSIPVTDGDKLIGMITDRDIAVRGIAKGHGPDTLVRELMTSGLICARSDDNIADIEHFAGFTGDNFYAHMDEEAAKASPIFEGRVAHGYLILSFAAGLFVDPDPGPVLANTGLENLKFLTPLYPGDAMRVELTVRSKSIKSEDTGQVRWAVEVFDQKDELVATYDLLTENVP